MTRPYLALTVAAFAADAILGLVLLRVVEEVGFPAIRALLVAYGL